MAILKQAERAQTLQTVAGGDPIKVIEMLDKVVPKGGSSTQPGSSEDQSIAKYIIAAAAAALVGVSSPTESF